VLDRQIPPNVFAVINKADLTSSNAPPVSTQVTTPINQVDLLIHKTDGRVTVNPLEPITYTLTYTNAGPGIAHNVIMTDTLPPTAFDVSSPTQPGVITPTIQPGRVIFQLGTLQPGQVGQTTISLKLSTLTTGAVVNTVVIGTSSHEINLNNNRSVDIDQVPPCDLLIHKTDGREQVQRGDTLTYTLTFTNTGPGIAFNAVVTDTFPATAINVSSPPLPGVITPTIDMAQHRITLQLGTLPPGHVGQTTVSMTVGPSQANGVDFVNTAAISTTSTETNRGNNISTDTDKVRATAVVLSEFNAGRQAGGVMVFWRTIAEQDNYGFRLYRSRTPKRADAVLITPAIIPGQGRGSADGASYSFFDADAPDGPVYYWLEDIDLNGHSEFHGPAQATIQAGRFRVLMPLVATGR